MAKKYIADIIEATSITGSLLGTATLASALVPGNKTVDGDLTVTGKITAEEFHTEFVSSSIVYKSGSTKFGNSSDDIMSVTGSLQVQGSITGSLFGTATNAVSASYAVTSSYAHFAATPTVQGVQGIQGIQGVGGSIGGQGTQGSTGAQGTTGTQGTTGIQGSTGSQGTTGIQGLQGRQGTTGVGTQGSTGAQGTTGSQGTTGTQGATGTQGSTGAQGTTGSQGTTGTQGSTGSQGTTGAQGTTGTQGIQGIQGVQGTNAGITSYTNASDNRVITSVSSTTINAESNLIFDGTSLVNYGSESREVSSYLPGTYTTNDLVSGTNYKWYSDVWRLGATRSGATPAADFVIQFNGVNKFNLGTNGAVTATSFGGAGTGLTGTASSLSIGGNAGTVSAITGNTGLLRDRLAASALIDGLTTSNFRTTLFGASTSGYQISTARWNPTPGPLSGLNNYGTMFAWAGADTHGFIAIDYIGAGVKVGGGNADLINWSKTLAFGDGTGASGTWGISVTGTAGSETISTVVGRGSTTSGNRPLTFDTSGGGVYIKGSGGGWATGYYFYGSSGTYRGGFGALGGNDGLSNYWIGPAYDNYYTYVDSSQLFHTNSVRGPVFYDSNNTDYYADFASTSDSALRVRGGALHGPNPTWGAYLLVGGDGRQNYTNSTTVASVCASNGNLHLDAASGYQTYINFYDGDVVNFGNGANNTVSTINTDGSHRPQVIYDYNDTGFYLDPNSTGTSLRVAGEISLPGTLTFRNGGAGATYMSEGYGIRIYGTNIQPAQVPNASLLVGGGASGGGYGSGNGYFTGDVTAYYSDRRLKHNLTLIDNAVEKVKSLNGYTYQHNELGQELLDENPYKVHAGLIAQEVQAVLPEVVTIAPFDLNGLDDQGNGISRSGENYLTIKYERVVPLLIEAIKEQQTQIENQQSQIDELKSLVKQLLG